MTRLYNIIAAMLAATCAGATVFPVSNSWYNYEPCLPMATLYTAIVERCELTGVTPPAVVQTWECAAGSSNDVFFVTNITANATNITHYTNIHLMTTNILTTNQFVPFEYSYVSPNESGTATGYPYVTRYALHELDTTIDALIPEFTAASMMTNGTYNLWFSNCPPVSIHSKSKQGIVLDESKAGILARRGIGYATNFTTNVYGHVTGGDAWYTRQPPTIDQWLLAEAHYTGAWTFVDVGDFDTRYYGGDTPDVVYTPAGTNPVQAVSVTSSGLALIESNQAAVVTTEVVVVSGTTTPTIERWYSVSNLAVTGGTPSTGDVVSVVWPGTYPLYGDYPYRLYAQDINERAHVLSLLTRTESSNVGRLPTTNDMYGVGTSKTNTGSWAEAKTKAEEDYDFPGTMGASFTRLGWQWSGTPHLIRYRASARNSKWTGFAASDTNHNPQIEYYVRSRLGDSTNSLIEEYEFTNNGHTNVTIDHVWQFALFKVITDNTAATNEVECGSTNFPSWAPSLPTIEPIRSGDFYYGYYIDAFDIIAFLAYTNLTIQPWD